MANIPLLPPSPRDVQSHAPAAESRARLSVDQALTAAAGSLPSTPQAGGTFSIDIDEEGGAVVSVSDLPALARLRTLVNSCEVGDSHVIGHQRLAQTASFAWRGVMECFYGELWDPSARRAVVEAAAESGANCYVYGPAADQLTGMAWREPYHGAAAEALVDLTAEAARRGIRSVWRCSPSAPLSPQDALRPSSDGDITDLLRKVESVAELGFDSVLIAFDDIENGLDPASARAYAHDPNPLAAAHADVINRVVGAIGAERVVACPTHYWGASESAYRARFGEALAEGVSVCWTGEAVIPSSISAADAHAVARELGHPLWIWDNYPVNDWDVESITASYFDSVAGLGNAVVPRRLPLAPLTGREGRLGEAAQAYTANAAIGALSGTPALRTALDFAWLGEAYDASTSWRGALRATGAPVEALEIVADAVGPVSGGPGRTPSRLARACGRVLSADQGEQADAIDALALEVDVHIAALNQLKAHPSGFVTALQPWLYELARQCTLSSLSVSALRSEPEGMARWSNALQHALRQPSTTVVASDAGRAVAMFARGVVAGGLPQIPA